MVLNQFWSMPSWPYCDDKAAGCPDFVTVVGAQERLPNHGVPSQLFGAMIVTYKYAPTRVEGLISALHPPPPQGVMQPNSSWSKPKRGGIGRGGGDRTRPLRDRALRSSKRYIE
ncbi:hypothetical protein GCM10027300_19850 [Modestobacter lapidis]